MANILTNLIPTIYMSLDTVSRELVGMIPNVFRNSTAEQAALGQSITYPITPLSKAQNIIAGVFAPDAGDQNIGHGTMMISKSRAVPVRWNGEEQRGANNAGWYAQVLKDQFTQAFRALTNEVENDLASLYTKASRAYGTAGTTPFQVKDDMSDFAEMLKILKDNGTGTSDLKLALGTDATTKLRSKTNLFKVNEAGTEDLLRNGNIGRLESFDICESAAIKGVAAGTGKGYLVNAPNGLPVGSTHISADTGTGTINPGDVVTFAGDPNKYVVAAAPGGGMFIISGPGLRVAAANKAPITLCPNFVPNLAFRRDAIHLITRAPAMPLGPDGKPMDMAEDVITVTDPFSGLSFQVAVYKQFRQILYYVGIAWGVANVKPDHTALLIG